MIFRVAQLSFYSAEANTPRAADLAGLLCCQGQVVSFARTAARLSVPLDQAWRARAIRAALAERRVDATLVTAEDGRPLVRTAFRTDLIRLAAEWTTESGKAVPIALNLDGAALRLWALAAGRWLENAYLLGLDPSAVATHEQLRDEVARAGVPTTILVGEQGPGLRVFGRRRLARLAELVGRSPVAAAEPHWPADPRNRPVAGGGVAPPGIDVLVR
jgi:hypothetical protein